nr:unnamed protein product [Callosobruchus analis]
MKNSSNKDILKAMNRRFTDLEHAITFNGEIMEELRNTIRSLTEENKNIKFDKEALRGRRKNIVITGLIGDKNTSINVKKVLTKLNVEESGIEDYKNSVLPSTDTNKSIVVVK